MNYLKNILFISTLSFLLVSFSQCSSSKKTSKHTTNKMEKNPSFTLKNAYYQHWTAGIEGGGSGITVVFTVEKNPENVTFNQIYFKGMLQEITVNNNLYSANFKTSFNQRKDVIMSSEKNAEYGNSLPKKEIDFPFTIAKTDAVLVYTEATTKKYYTIKNIAKKAMQQFPSAPRP